MHNRSIPSSLAWSWAQSFVRRGATFIGNTGYGYGDSDLIAYSERLATNFVQELGYWQNNQPPSVGTALLRAKQRYYNAIGSGSLSNYDEKARRRARSRLTAWRVAEEDAEQHEHYDRYAEAVEEMLASTDFPHAPWVIVEATDRFHTRIRVLEEVIRAFEDRLASDLPHPRAHRAEPHGPAPCPAPRRSRPRGV